MAKMNVGDLRKILADNTIADDAEIVFWIELDEDEITSEHLEKAFFENGALHLQHYNR